MARIDSLLRIVDQQRANELRLGVDREPEMYRSGARQRLSIPATSDEMLRDLLAGLLTPETEQLLARDGRFELLHQAGELGAYRVVVSRRGDGSTNFDAVFLRYVGAKVTTPAAPAVPPVELVAPPVERPGPPASPATAPTGAIGDLLAHLLQRAVSERASDVHLRDGDTVALRRDGRLVPLPELDVPSVAELLSSVIPAETLRAVEAGRACDGSVELADLGRFRFNVYRSTQGLAAAIRVLPRRVPTLAELAVPSSLEDLVKLSHGLVLLSGPTGCGKSTTLAAMAELALQKRSALVITLEDPVEYLLTTRGGRGLVRQRQVGRDVPSFAAGLRDALREDPDVLLIGELRDQETISLALTAAETGHLVLGSVHGRSSAATVERIVDSCAAERQAHIRTQLADSLRAVVSQRLVPRAKGPGRVAAVEILRVTHNVASLIREGKTQQIPTAIQSGRGEGMIPLERVLADLVSAGEITPDAARAAASDVVALSTYLS
jgi:twitching motility protein PilT